MVTLIQHQLVVVLTGTANPADGDVDIRCSLADQETDKRKPCPFGQTALINSIKRAAGLTVQDDGDDDRGVFAMPIFTQDRSGWRSSLALSHGSLSDPKIVTEKNTLNIDITLSDAAESGIEGTPYAVNLFEKIKSQTDLEPDLLTSVTAPGRLFDGKGNVIYTSGSPLPHSGDHVLLRSPVVGKVTVSYTVTGQRQIATISPRPDAAQNNYQSTLWITSSCGQSQHYNIEVPECMQQAWYKEHGYPLDFLDPEDGETVIEDPQHYAEGADIELTWELCGNKKAANQTTTDFFDSKLPGSGPVCFPGQRCVDIKGNPCG